MKKLIPMTDFVLQEQKGGQQVNSITHNLHHALTRIKNYAKFLKQPLKLEMFVPCNEDGNFLEEPELQIKQISFDEWEESYDLEECKKYQQAKERVLFKWFEEKNGYASYTENWLDIDEDFCENKTIEDLVYYNLELTEEKAKELGL